jgi:hypothetical protein
MTKVREGLKIARWWLASALCFAALRLTARESGDSPIWAQEFAISYVRAFAPSDGRYFTGVE